MQVQALFFQGLGAEISGGGVIALIVMLTCLLISEIVCIGILLWKLIQARRAQDGQSEEDSSFWQNSIAVLSLSAIPQSTFTTISVLVWVTMAATAVLAGLLVYCRLQGYDFSLLLWNARGSKDADASAKYDETEQEAEDTDASEEEAIPAFAEESTDLTAEEVPAMQETTEVVTTSASTVPTAAGADGQAQPYKIVEKVVTETYKEVVKEAPAAPVSATNADAFFEKLSDFLDYEMQKRKESELASASVAYTDEELDEDEDEVEEDDDELEADEPRDEDDVDDTDDRFTGNERIIGFDEGSGCYIVAHYRKSFEAKLIQARPHIKKYYSELKNALLAYKESKSRISWAADTIQNERQTIAKINVKTKVLELYLALDPALLDDSVYRGKDVGHKKKYADTPFQYKIRSPRKLKWALELVQQTCEEHGLSPIDADYVDYEAQYPFDTTDNLVQRGLIREYLRQEKSATTFELAPDHVPEVAQEDASVIPANANFSWEFDNERLETDRQEEVDVAEAEEPAEMPITKEETAEEVAEEPTETAPTVDAASGVVRETVKVTEMRYTERYYADAPTTYEQVVTTSETAPELIEATLGEETDAPVVEDAQTEAVASAEMQDEPQDEAIPAVTPIVAEVAEESDFSADKFDGADPFADFRDDDVPWTEEEEAEETGEEDEVDEEQEELFFSDGDDAEAEETEEIFEDIEETEEAADDFEEAEETEEIEEVEEEFEEAEEKPTPVKYQVFVSSDPAIAAVDLFMVERAFANGDTVNIASLRAKGLVEPSAKVLKIYVSGELSRSLNVEADHFTLDAIRAIMLAGGNSAMIR